jgi:hypothetical protein
MKSVSNFIFFVLYFLIVWFAKGSKKRRGPSPEPVPIPKFDVYTLDSLLSTSLPAAADSNKPLIIDCIQYVNEPVTYFRLSYLRDYVDLFILIELKDMKTNSYLMDKSENQLLQELENEKKLIKMRLDEFPYEFKYRQNSSIKSDLYLFHMTPYHFRDTKMKHAGLLKLAKEKYLVDSFFHEFKKKYANKSYVLMFGKNDEIPKLEIIKKLPSLYHHPALVSGLRLEMTTLYYDFHWVLPEERVRHTTIFQDSKLQEITSLIDLLWFGSEKLPLMFRSGWHMNFFHETSALEKTIIPLYYPDYNFPDIVNSSWITLCRENGYDIFKRKYIFITKYDGSEGYPHCTSCLKYLSNPSLFRLPADSRPASDSS